MTAQEAREVLASRPEVIWTFAMSGNPHLATEAVRVRPRLLEYVWLNEVKDDWFLIHEVVQRDGECLQWASDRLNQDGWLIRRAIEQSPEALFTLRFGEDEAPMNVIRAITLWPHIRGRISPAALRHAEHDHPRLYAPAVAGILVYQRLPPGAMPPPPPRHIDQGLPPPPPPLPILAEAGPILAEAGEEAGDPSDEEEAGESSESETASEEEEAGTSSESETPSTMPAWYASDVESDVSTPPPPPPPWPPGARVDHRTGHVIFEEP